MKKILYVATVDIHIRTFHLPYLKMLKEEGYEVHVATSGNEHFPYCDIKHQICIQRSPFKFDNIKAIKQLKKIIDKEKFDIIHCHTPMGAVVTRLAAKAARRKGTKVIYTAHGFHFYKGAPLINWLLFYPIEKHLAKYTDALITINKEDYELAKKKFLKRCKNIKYTPGVGVDYKKFNVELSENEKEKLRESIGIEKSDFVIIFPARLDRNKNQLMLINAMEILQKKHKNIHLLLPGADELNGYYQKIAVKKKVDKNVHFLGFRSDVANLLKISDLAVSTSLREGCAINLIEALFCNIPVVATNNRGHRDIIQNGENGFLISFNVNELCEKIEYFLNNRNRFKLIKESADKFAVDEILEKVLEIYRSV